MLVGLFGLKPRLVGLILLTKMISKNVMKKVTYPDLTTPYRIKENGMAE